MTHAVREILERIQALSDEERLLLEEQLARSAEASGKARAHQSEPIPACGLGPAELRKLPRQQRQAFLAEAAAIAEQDYRSDKDLTGFEAFSEEEMDDDEANSR